MDLYREVLMEHYKNPLNKGRISNPTVSAQGVNAMCGDSLVLDLTIRNNQIQEAKFDGEACAVSTAAASIFTDFLIKKSVEEANNISKAELLDLIGVELTTSRIKCATLILEALEEALKKYEKTI